MNSPCPICSAETTLIGTQVGKLDRRQFYMRHCSLCHFSFIQNYRSDFEILYNKDYYHGKGADPLVDYVYELNNIKTTIRNYEWSGIFKVFRQLCPNGGRWLDFGCGGGGMVRYALSRGVDAMGVEDGWLADQGRSQGLPILSTDELNRFAGSYDFVTAIEVIEHIPQPIEVLKTIRQLLKPGGVFFLTTGNARPFRQSLLDWGYTQCPDVHVSFFEPKTLERSLTMAGFESQFAPLSDGLIDVIKYKVLKNFQIKNRHGLIDALPWQLIARVVDAKYEVSKMPYGVAVGN